jgi:hypothetical protein
MSLAGTVGAGDRVGLVRLRLRRTCIILVVGSVADKRTSPVGLRITAAGDHRGAGYSLGALTVIPVI